MNSSIFFLLVAPFSVLVFAALERLKLNYDKKITKRDSIGIFLEIFNRAFGFLIGLTLMNKLVNFVSPFEIFSISNLNIPTLAKFLISFLCIDFIHYISHRVHHLIPMLWRFHRLHHSDNSVDSVTSLIHHPLELLSIFLTNITAYVLFDIPVIVINAYTLVLVMHSPFTHTKLKLNHKIDHLLSYFIVTPNFHRIHHSIVMSEGNTSFGIFLPFWDRVFNTYESKEESYMSNKIKFGISINQSPSSLSIKEFLINPFKGFRKT